MDINISNQWGAQTQPISGGEWGVFEFRYSIEFEMACPIIQHTTSTQRPIVYTLEEGQVAETHFSIFTWDTATQGYPQSANSYWIAIGY